MEVSIDDKVKTLSDVLIKWRDKTGDERYVLKEIERDIESYLIASGSFEIKNYGCCETHLAQFVDFAIQLKYLKNKCGGIENDKNIGKQ